MTLKKPVRIVDEDLLEAVRRMPCLACITRQTALEARGAIGEDWICSHPHHVVSRGAGGGDIATNVVSLCGQHHREIHQVGNAEMARRYPIIGHWLRDAGHEL